VTLRFTASAERELKDAADWYDARHAGLGAELLVAVDAALERHYERTAGAVICLTAVAT
jgi:hypothetical protein